ncbi:hypothetical protein An02g14320 [Aspergillus niger]|uniref:Uncharacterized protein n=2 Tax=Aspergillus niger TaxID=5061 RepID=A2QFF2_ASPNC|nr:hypothetical protein An02g14320 [Aspergillus niger]CAK48863.1 hypothetical protein An02g14320 [Aspergillus niger]
MRWKVNQRGNRGDGGVVEGEGDGGESHGGEVEGGKLRVSADWEFNRERAGRESPEYAPRRERREALLGRPVEGRQSGRAASLPQAGTPYPNLSFAASIPESSATTCSPEYTKGCFAASRQRF